MRRVLLLTVLAVSLTATTAQAGGWAAFSLSEPTGARVWSPELTLMQHGVRPLDGVQPAIMIERAGVRRSFRGTPSGRPGGYRFRVVFPDAGRWAVTLDDGFSRTHDVGPVDVRGGTAAAPAVPGAGSSATASKRWALGAGGGAVLLIVIASAWLLRPAGAGRTARREATERGAAGAPS